MPYFTTTRSDAPTTLFFQDWGQGDPVVFCHGWAVGADLWEYQTTPLSTQGLRCIAFDRRGCGRSDQPDRGYDFDTFADDLADLIDHLDLDGVTLVAHSMAAGEVTRYLSRHGAARIAGAVLLAPTTPFLLQTDDNPDGAPAAAAEGLMAALAEDRPAWLAAAAPAFFGAGVSPEIVDWGVRLILRASARATIEMVRTMNFTDFRAEMDAFTIPTLVIHGDADQIAPLDRTGRRTAELIPGAELVVYEGASHGLFFTEKDRFNADLLAFVRTARPLLQR